MGRSTEPRIAGVLLAAGAARRFGRPKQLAVVDGVTLVRRSAQALLDAGLPLLVITGAHAEAVLEALQGLPFEHCHNGDWAQGMGRSIGAAFERLLPRTHVEAALIALCDQPRIGADALRRLLAAHQRMPDGITASSFDGVTGPPCIFARRDFASLARLDGSVGARALIEAQADRLQRVNLPEAALDIDTPEQYRTLVGG
ncbi:MAG: nucleotidyltransferase family protein [Sinimarinibacterium flocculans]|uniref:nucleotidyltransferase family protein n=1 Tax=Sinimarinibacterium flocculans TaxID=985250 RepID=UPI003C657F43